MDSVIIHNALNCLFIALPGRTKSPYTINQSLLSMMCIGTTVRELKEKICEKKGIVSAYALVYDGRVPHGYDEGLGINSTDFSNCIDIIDKENPLQHLYNR